MPRGAPRRPSATLSEALAVGLDFDADVRDLMADEEGDPAAPGSTDGDSPGSADGDGSPGGDGSGSGDAKDRAGSADGEASSAPGASDGEAGGEGAAAGDGGASDGAADGEEWVAPTPAALQQMLTDARNQGWIRPGAAMAVDVDPIALL